MSINLDTLAFLVRDDVTTVKCRFNASGKCYTFKALRSLADTLTLNTPVVAATAEGYKVIIVDSVDVEPDVDPENGIQYHWLIQRVDTSSYQKLLEQQDAIVERLSTCRRMSQRQQALVALGISDPQQFLAGITDAKE